MIGNFLERRKAEVAESPHRAGPKGSGAGGAR
jgi:hypothetical protein